MINLLAGPYVIAVKERSLIGRIFGHPIWHVDKVDIWPCALDGDARLSSEEAGEEKEYLRLLSVFLNAGGFYYSPRYDLTSTLQRHHKDSGDLSKLLRINDSVPFSSRSTNNPHSRLIICLLLIRLCWVDC